MGYRKRPVEGLYGRARSKALSALQQSLLDDFLPTVSLPQDGPVEMPAGETWLEVGMGGGEHFIAQAKANPDKFLMGFEPFQNGMAKTLTAIQDNGLANVSVTMDDARPYLARMPNGSFSRAFILYPDPWPKRRHWKRRIISDSFVAEMARLIRPGGELRFVSDIPHYQQWALWHILRNGNFDWQAETADDWRKAPADHVTTKYEQKALREKRTPAYLLFTRKGV